MSKATKRLMVLGIGIGVGYVLISGFVEAITGPSGERTTRLLTSASIFAVAVLIASAFRVWRVFQ